MPATFAVDLKNTYDLKPSLVPAVRTANANGSGVDCLGYEGPLFLFIEHGTTDISSTDETYTYKVEESSDNSTFTAITGAVNAVTYTAAASYAGSTAEIVNVTNRQKRYVRAVLTVGGTTPSVAGSASFLLRRKIAGGSGVLTTVS